MVIGLEGILPAVFLYYHPFVAQHGEQLKEIVLHILKFGEGERDWWLEYLEINTGLDNLTDYIFYPDLIGLDFDATLEQIADKIIADRK